MAGAGQALALHDRDKSGGGRLLLAGVDEAGRGCWAGPVVAAAVVLPAGWCPDELDDSKRLTPRQREKLYDEIRASALDWGACAVSSVDIDRTDILRATLLAMTRAVVALQPQYGQARGSDDASQQLVVIGMGKLGGEELNYSSDIDLIFLSLASPNT